MLPCLPSAFFSPLFFFSPLLNAKAINTLSIVENKSKTQSNLVLAQSREKHHYSTNTCDAQRLALLSFDRNSFRFFSLFFLLYPARFHPLISQRERERDEGELGEGLEFMDRRDRRKRTCWKHDGGSNSPVLIPIHVLMQTLTDIMPHWWGACCLHKQDVCVREGGELWLAGYVHWICACLCVGALWISQERVDHHFSIMCYCSSPCRSNSTF